MMTDSARQLLAVAETVAPWLDEEQAQRAIRYLMALASEGGDQAALEKHRQLSHGRQDRELRRHEVAGGER